MKFLRTPGKQSRAREKQRIAGCKRLAFKKSGHPVFCYEIPILNEGSQLNDDILPPYDAGGHRPVSEFDTINDATMQHSCEHFQKSLENYTPWLPRDLFATGLWAIRMTTYHFQLLTGQNR